MAFPSDWRSGPGQPTFQPFFVAAVEVLGRAMQAGWLISVSCTLHFPLQLQFLSLDRSRPGRRHAMLLRPHAGEHRVTPVRAASKETNSPRPAKITYCCKNLHCFVLFSFLITGFYLLFCVTWYLFSISNFRLPLSDFRFLLSAFCFRVSFFRFLNTSHRQLAKSTHSNLDPPSLVCLCTHSLLSARVLCLAGLRDSDKSFQSIWKDGRRFTIVM